LLELRHVRRDDGRVQTENYRSEYHCCVAKIATECVERLREHSTGPGFVAFRPEQCLYALSANSLLARYGEDREEGERSPLGCRPGE
jgi:hypothetical protein